jgi:DNA-binding GntR family transcriptional regulator
MRCGFIELTRVRKALEGIAADMACRNVTPKLIAELEKINARLHRSIAARDILACLRLNQAFHFTLYSASCSEILPSLIEALWLRAGPFMYFSLTAPTTPWDASGHDKVIKSLRKGDARATRAAIERDIAGSATYLLKKSAAFRGGVGSGIGGGIGIDAPLALSGGRRPRKR